MRKNDNNNGRSMVEMLGVLAIIGVLSVGGIAGYSKAMSKFKINKTTDQISMLVANLRTAFAVQGSYNNLDNEHAIKLGVVSDDMYRDGSTVISNAFGGEVIIEASDRSSNGDNRAFVVAYDGLTTEACVTLATLDFRNHT